MQNNASTLPSSSITFVRGEDMSATLIRLLLIGVFLDLTQGDAQDSFRAAQFRGLTMGKDRVADAIRLLGKPETILRKPDATWIYYQDLGPAPGRVEIIADTKTTVIKSVNVFPSELSLVRAKAFFGPAFKIVHYDWDSCLSSGGSSPVFESKDGPLERIVYAEKGIVIKADGAKVDYISYSSKPPGTKRSRCKDEDAQRN